MFELGFLEIKTHVVHSPLHLGGQYVERYTDKPIYAFPVTPVFTGQGKKKLILSGCNEAALAAFGTAPYIFPDKKIHLQYATTSPKPHKVLGVEPPVFD